MKRAFAIILVLLYINPILGQETFRPSTDGDVVNVAISGISIKDKNITQTLAEIAYKYDVPIGLEVSSSDNLLDEGRKTSLEIHQGTIKDVLDAIVTKNSLYAWEIRNGVINVYPKDCCRDLFLRELQNTVMQGFYVKDGASRIGLRESITQSKEVKGLLDRENILVENETFSPQDLAKLGGSFSLESSNISVIDLLNRVAKESKTKYWVVNRYGTNRQYLLLNL